MQAIVKQFGEDCKAVEAAFSSLRCFDVQLIGHIFQGLLCMPSLATYLGAGKVCIQLGGVGGKLQSIDIQ